MKSETCQFCGGKGYHNFNPPTKIVVNGKFAHVSHARCACKGGFEFLQEQKNKNVVYPWEK